MTIQQAYQILDLDGSENSEVVDKKYRDLYNNALIRLTNEFDERRKTELEKHIREINEARQVLHQVPSVNVPKALVQQYATSPKPLSLQHPPLHSPARPSKTASFKLRAAMLTTVLFIILVSFLGISLKPTNETTTQKHKDTANQPEPDNKIKNSRNKTNSNRAKTVSKNQSNGRGKANVNKGGDTRDKGLSTLQLSPEERARQANEERHRAVKKECSIYLNKKRPH